MWRSAKRAEFERLVRQHLPDALSFAIRLVGCPHVAEDVVQNAMLRASKGWRSFRGESQFKTWFFRIIVNCFRDHLRASKAPFSKLSVQEIDRRQREPIHDAQNQELMTTVDDAMQKLPNRQREVLILSVCEDMSARQIADTLDMTAANVHSTLHLARQRIKQLLQPYFAEE